MSWWKASRLRTAAARIGFTWCAIVLVTTVSCGLMWWTNHNWRENFRDYLPVLDDLRQARIEALKGYLAAEHFVAGEMGAPSERQDAFFEQAALRIRDVRGVLASLGERLPARAELQSLLRTLDTYEDRLNDFAALSRQRVDARPQERAVLGLEQRKRFADLEKASQSLDQAMQRQFLGVAVQQDRINTLLIVLWASFLILLAVFASLTGRRRKQAEMALRESEARWEFALEGAGDGVWDWDVATGVMYFSRTWKAMLGYGEDEVGSRMEEWEGRVHPEDRGWVRKALDRHLRGEDPFYQAEYRIFCKDGSFKWILDRGKVVSRDDGGGPLRAIGTHADMTARRRMEDLLRESEERAKSILRAAPAGICMTVDRVMKDVNQFMAALTGYAREELIGRSTQMLYPTEEEFRAVGERGDRLPQRGVETTETQWRRKDGEVRDIRIASSPILLANGARGVTFIAEDITESKQAEEALVAAKNQAETANRAKSEFVATMSHEIRTPLNGILGMLQLLQISSLDKQQEEYVGTALQAGKNLLSILNEILDLSVVESGKTTLREEPFVFRQLLEQAAAPFALHASSKKIQLVWEADPDVPESVVGDSVRLRQVLFNLIGNAVKFTAHGEVRLKAEIRGRAPDGRLMVRLAVTDTGIGIPPDKLQDIFMPFTQVEGGLNRKYGGTGLGLAVVDRFVRLMEGAVEVESSEGRGSTFLVQLPMREPSPAAEAERPLLEPEARRPSRQGELRILVAEDEPANQFFLIRTLEHMGHTAVCAGTGEEALAAMRRERFDLVLMDIHMPRMDGIEAAHRIREDASGDFDPRTPIVALTAYAMTGDRECCLEAGMDDYLAKPIEVPQLERVIKRILGGGEAAE